jgi:hypothetical protein
MQLPRLRPLEQRQPRPGGVRNRGRSQAPPPPGLQEAAGAVGPPVASQARRRPGGGLEALPGGGTSAKFRRGSPTTSRTLEPSPRVIALKAAMSAKFRRDAPAATNKRRTLRSTGTLRVPVEKRLQRLRKTPETRGLCISGLEKSNLTKRKDRLLRPVRPYPVRLRSVLKITRVS